ncbi:ABC transporter permease [Dolosicoccus paucivorans]|uniref:ABC transporter permease n=1 Tax=Dolosicoccus paucivorans TaxID=84521 RepID=UPI00087EA512|nr:ABC transporter permease [Dolosicoccus paucivorans]SDI86405.1 nucleoside ABC transporter membrane protein [Dolosicoccus paucivorans]
MKRYTSIIVPILTVVIGLFFGALVMWAFKYDAVAGYKALWQGAVGTPFAIGQTIRAATPLIFTGLGFAVAYTAGFFNIGVAGQALFGWLASVWVGLLFPEASGWLVLPLAILAGALAGALWAGIAGILKAYFNTSEVIVTIMLNYVAVYINDYLIRYVMTDRADASPFVGPNASLRIQWLADLTKGSTIHAGIFLALAFAVIIYIFMQKTTFGFELKAVGLNKFAAQFAGMNATRNIILAMMLSGALAGLGGVMSGLGEFRNIFLMNGTAPEIGFDGMAVSLLGANNPLGIVFASLLFGGLKTGGTFMPLGAEVPSEIVNIVIALIIFFVGSKYIITYLLNLKKQTTVSAANIQEGSEE